MSVTSFGYAAWRPLLAIAVLIGGVSALQVRAKWAYVVSALLFSYLAFMAVLVVVDPTQGPAADKAGAYEAGAGFGHFASFAFTFAVAAYVVFSRSSRAYFGVSPGPARD